MEYFRKTGAMGGRARAKNHTPEELSAWAKKGGRPRGSGKKQVVKKQRWTRRKSTRVGILLGLPLRRQTWSLYWLQVFEIV
jgi:hypothetical protein